MNEAVCEVKAIGERRNACIPMYSHAAIQLLIMRGHATMAAAPWDSQHLANPQGTAKAMPRISPNTCKPKMSEIRVLGKSWLSSGSSKSSQSSFEFPRGQVHTHSALTRGTAFCWMSSRMFSSGHRCSPFGVNGVLEDRSLRGTHCAVLNM